MASEIWHSTFLSVDFQPIKRFTKADCINHRYFLAVQSFGNKTTLENFLISKSTYLWGFLQRKKPSRAVPQNYKIPLISDSLKHFLSTNYLILLGLSSLSMFACLEIVPHHTTIDYKCGSSFFGLLCLNFFAIFMYFVHKLLVINLFDPRNAAAAAKNDFYLNLKINI